MTPGQIAGIRFAYPTPQRFDAHRVGYEDHSIQTLRALALRSDTPAGGLLMLDDDSASGTELPAREEQHSGITSRIACEWSAQENEHVNELPRT